MKLRNLVAILLCMPLVACATVTSTVDKSGPFLITALPQAIATGFPFVSSSELLVLDTGPTSAPHDPATVLTLGSDYQVSGGNYNGANQMQTGTVSVVSSGSHSVAVNDYIVIMRNVPINQTSSFTSTGPLTVALLEQMGDKLATLSQQVNEVTTRSLRFENFEFLDGTLNKTLRSNSVIGFDANGALKFIPNFEPGGDAVFNTITVNNTSTLHFVTTTGINSTGVINVDGDVTGSGHQFAAGNSTFDRFLFMDAFSDTESGTLFGVSKAGSFGLYTIKNAGSTPLAILIGSSNTNTPVVIGVNNVEQGRFDANGLSVNHATAVNPTPATGSLIHVTAPDSVQAVISLDAFGSNTVLVGRQASGTSASPTATNSGSGILALVGNARGATGYSNSNAFLSYQAAENWSDSAQGTQLLLRTTANGSTTQTTQITVKNSGIVNLTNTPNYANNAAAISGGLVAGDVYRNGDALQIVH